MVVYHGTTTRKAQNIYRIGFLPMEPSRKVWFAVDKKYALRRAKNQALRTHDLPIVLQCNIDMNQMHNRFGKKGIFYKNGIIAINGSVPSSVLRSCSILESLASPEELAAWVNELLGLKLHNGVSFSHPGIYKLSFFLEKRLTDARVDSIYLEEFLQKASQCLLEFFQGIDIEKEILRPQHNEEANSTLKVIDEREEEVLDCLCAATAEQQIRGLKLLAEINGPLLFDWCMRNLDGEFKEVRVAVLHIMLVCDRVDPEVILPCATSEGKRLRAAAIKVLAKHSSNSPLHWFERALNHDSIDFYSENTIATWINHILGLKAGWDGVTLENPGIHKLSRWMEKSIFPSGRNIRIGEFLHKAIECLPQFSVVLESILEKLRAYRHKNIHFEAEPSGKVHNAREEEALDCLISKKPKRRIRGIKMLAELEDIDLFDWCAMLLSDGSTEVRIAALRTMLHCDKVDIQVILPITESENKRIRAAATAILAKHSGENAPYWFEKGLEDESACVRLETAALLSELAPTEHKYIFELALVDPNPRIRHIAQKLTTEKGFK